MIRFSIILAAIPLVTLGSGYALRPSVPARAIEVEGVRAQRVDTDTFRYRYGPVADMPPAVETRLEPLLLVTHDPPAGAARMNERQTVGATASVRSRVSTSYSICTRHGMRKVMVGRYKWKCRR